MIKTLLLSILFIGLTAQAATISVTVPKASYSVGDLIPIDISISNVSDLYAFQFDLSFDPAVLSAQSVAEGGYFLSNGVSFSPGTLDNSAGTISFVADSLSGPGPGFTGDTLLTTAMFTALRGGTTTIAPLNVTLLDSSLAEIVADTSATSVTASGVTATPEPNTSALLLIGVAYASIIKIGTRTRGFGSRFV